MHVRETLVIGKLEEGVWCSGLTYINGKLTGDWSGYYDGMRESQHPEGGMYHYFVDGQINGVNQKIHGTPVANLTVEGE